MLAVTVTACNAGGDDVEGTPTATVTVTETVTESATAGGGQQGDATPTSTPTVEETATAAASGDACEAVEPMGSALSFIFVTGPSLGQQVTPGFEVTGCGNTFEATYVWELLDGQGAVLADGFGTMTCGSGCQGDFDFTVDYSVGQTQVGTLRVFEESARDGSEVNVNSVPLILQP